ncbi:hypothetical protein CIPAW_12G004200 [Carya illinoinensis]|uniref:Uncharacterized protein n=1 Tax=Carya illinoinensis TaxID=32201 RepID=A0A8T1NT20_CARIL|nr:hypothetical protein CIPAW_12G004200 [Carya illinoinensis]
MGIRESITQPPRWAYQPQRNREARDYLYSGTCFLQCHRSSGGGRRRRWMGRINLGIFEQVGLGQVMNTRESGESLCDLPGVWRRGRGVSGGCARRWSPDDGGGSCNSKYL